MNKATLNYWIDVSIGVAFVLSAVTGLVFLLPVNFASGSNPGVLGISYRLWSEVHTWSSVVMIAGVVAHLALHWRWVVMMTKRLLPKGKQPETVPLASGAKVSRRRFLYLGLTMAIAGVVAACHKAVDGILTIEAEQRSNSDGLQPDEPIQPSPQEGGVACPQGLVYDPYPGHCRRYTDRNGDNICDYSMPGSGDNPVQDYG